MYACVYASNNYYVYSMHSSTYNVDWNDKLVFLQMHDDYIGMQDRWRLLLMDHSKVVRRVGA